MADYKSMYVILFRAMTNAIALMQDAQQQTEEIFMSSEESVLKIVSPDGDEHDEDGDC